MGLLLYKSDEMYSSTELIRKSKMIFNKVLDNEIDKAIILRDGKPCFLLMEFQKYEKIMAEFEELKAYVDTLKNPTKQNKKIQQIKDPVIQQITDTIKEEVIDQPITQEIIKKSTNTIPIQNITPEDKTKIEEISKSKKKVEITEAQEIKDAYDSIESMNFDDDMKKQAQEKIKIKILQARKERAKILEDEKQNKEELKEELILQRQLKEEKMKKDRELQEFWD